MKDSYSTLKLRNEELTEELKHSKLEVQNARDVIKQEVKKNQDAQETIESLKYQLEWLRKQLFGAKTEKRFRRDDEVPGQLSLFSRLEVPEIPPSDDPETGQPTTVKSYERKARKKKIEFLDEDSKLKFTKDTPIKVIEVPNPKIEGLVEKEDYTVIGNKSTYRLAQRSSYVVLEYRQKTVKLNNEIIKPALPTLVFEKSFSDVSFISSVLVDKFAYHLPLYRQHQRLQASGIHISRGYLTKLVHRAAELLEPIQKSILSSILTSSVIAVDETPLKAGRSKGKMKQSYLWPMYGEQDEVAFLFSSNRSKQLLIENLSDYQGTILCDGYSAYRSFNLQQENVQLACCWVHLRRKFFDALGRNPKLVEPALEIIGKLYAIEAKNKDDPKKLASARQHESKPLVETFFKYLEVTILKEALLPSSLYRKAVNYAFNHKNELKLFLTAPSIPMDTNHLEREIRPIAIGRKNWMFCFTEVGAEKSATIYTMLSSCKLAGVNPLVYLTDVLQRIDFHPAKDIELLVPRLWKQHFSHAPMQSDIDN